MTTKLSNEEKRKQDTEEITKSFDAVIMPGKENQFKMAVSLAWVLGFEAKRQKQR